MVTRTVVTTNRRTTRPATRDFLFTEAMIPGISADGKVPSFLRDYRALGWDTFQKLPLPTTRDEAWRRTDLSGLDRGSFRLSNTDTSRQLPPIPKDLLRSFIGNNSEKVILLPAGRSDIQVDPDISAQGVIFTDLTTASQKHADILSRILGKLVHPDDGKFAGLTAALAQTGVLVYIPRGLKLEKPLHSILWGPGTGLAYFSHVLVWVDDGASATYVHEAASPTEQDGQTMHSGIVEIIVGEGSSLRFVELQSWGKHVWNFTHERVSVARDGNLEWVFGSLGSHLTKNFSDLDLIGQGATGKISGFYFTDGDQHLDHDTQQNHLAPHTTSDLLFKGALKDYSRSVWQGMIYVAPCAQKTDGYQANRNLTLSPHARADSIPGLEILADDVRCTHGATVGKIDQDQMFYLNSRGIPPKEAEQLIVEGFFDPIMQRIPFEGVRKRFQESIHQKMG